MPTNTISKTRRKPKFPTSNRNAVCRPSGTTGRPGAPSSQVKVKVKEKAKDEASLSEVASSANQGAGAAKKTSSLAKNVSQFSEEASEIMTGARAGADGRMRSRNLSSAVWDAFNTTEGASGGGAKGLALDAALTPVGVVNGVKGTKEAIGQLRNGNLREGGKGLLLDGGGLVGDGLGVVDTAASAVEHAGKLSARLPQGGTANSLASKAAAVAPQATRVASVAGKASGVIGGALAVAEGGFQVRDGLQQDDKAKAGRGAAKSLAGGMMLAGTVTGNPLLVGAGGLTYAGVSIYENREKIGRATATAAKFVGNAAKNAVEGHVQAATFVAGAAANGASTVGNLAVRGADQVGRAAEAVKDKAVDAAAERVRSVGSTAKNVLGWLS